jgi:hypothetical protein
MHAAHRQVRFFLIHPAPFPSPRHVMDLSSARPALESRRYVPPHHICQDGAIRLDLLHPGASGAAGADQTGLVGEHDSLHPVAQVELREQAGDVRFDSR